MKLRSVASYFCKTPLYRWTGASWSATGINGQLSEYTGGAAGNAVDKGERKMVTKAVLPANAPAIRMGQSGPIYVVGYREDAQAFTYLVYKATDFVEVYRPTKAVYNSGVIGSVTWTKSSSSWANIVYAVQSGGLEGGERQALFADALFTDFLVRLPSGTDVTTEDELRTTDETYIVHDVYPYTSMVVAKCERKKAVI